MTHYETTNRYLAQEKVFLFIMMDFIMEKKFVISGLISSLLSLNTFAASISTTEVESIQKEWGEGIVKIGTAKDARKAATEHIEKFYAFDDGQVLFKPTLAAVDQFRGTKKEALSYFIGQDLSEDKGFALAPYIKVRWENEGIITDQDSAIAMGNYFFTKKDGQEIKVEYTFGYVKDSDGKLKINVHHSSIPYSN
ncbi:hypothetical protein [Vibrio jasicida]|uniref:hypothetical protein n=1 Tax=Vibrio jasicida TaxID=766224 RepID=UPI001D103A7A|nr:hypothetical protein [Vibrio jasicida]